MSQSTFSSSEPVSVYYIVSGTLGAICSLIVLTLLILVVCVHKAYKTTLQRLVLYHIIFSLFFELSQLSVIFYFEKEICAVLVYLSLYFMGSWTVYVTVVTNCLLIFTLRLMRGSPRIWQHGKVAECVCICLAIIVPMINYAWILPATDGSYANAVCENTTYYVLENYRVPIVLNTMYLVMGVEVLFVTIFMCCVFCLLRLRFRSRQLTSSLKNLLYYVVASTVILVFAIYFTITIYFSYFHLPLESLVSPVEIMSGVVLPFIVVGSTMLSLLVIWPNCKCLVCGSKTDHRRQQRDENINETQGATNPTSHPMNQPSHTYFSIPYTGAFTQVTVNEHDEKEGERTPLI